MGPSCTREPSWCSTSGPCCHGGPCKVEGRRCAWCDLRRVRQAATAPRKASTDDHPIGGVNNAAACLDCATGRVRNRAPCRCAMLRTPLSHRPLVCCPSPDATPGPCAWRRWLELGSPRRGRGQGTFGLPAFGSPAPPATTDLPHARTRRRYAPTEDDRLTLLASLCIDHAATVELVGRNARYPRVRCVRVSRWAVDRGHGRSTGTTRFAAFGTGQAESIPALTDQWTNRPPAAMRSAERNGPRGTPWIRPPRPS